MSTDEQAEKGYSLPTQLEACREYAGRLGAEVAAEITDDCSGAIPVAERPGGAKVYALLERCAVDLVIQYTIDRTARDDREYPIEFLIFLRDVQDAGAELHFVDSGRADGSVLDIFKAWAASDERRKIKERTRRGKRARVHAGGVMVSSRPAYGYKSERDEKSGLFHLAIDEEEAQIVRLIYAWYTFRANGEAGVDTAAWAWLKELLMNPAFLSAHLRERRAEREREAHPLRERLLFVEGQLDKYRAQLDKLLPLYLDGEYSKAELYEHKALLEEQIGRLEEARANLRAHLQKQALTDEQIRTIEALARDIGRALAQAEDNFETRRRLVEFLDVQCVLTVEDGEKVAHFRCEVGESVRIGSFTPGFRRVQLAPAGDRGTRTQMG